MGRDTAAFLSETVVVSLLVHGIIRRYGWACAVACLVSATLYFILTFVQLIQHHGSFGKLMWFPQVVFGCSLYALPVTAVVGLPFLAWRRRAGRKAKSGDRAA